MPFKTQVVLRSPGGNCETIQPEEITGDVLLQRIIKNAAIGGSCTAGFENYQNALACDGEIVIKVTAL
jgi:hypothetical protein